MAKFILIGGQAANIEEAAAEEIVFPREFNLPVFINTHIDPDMKALESSLLSAISSGGEGGWPCDIESVSVGEVVLDSDTTSEYHMDDATATPQASWRSTATIVTVQPIHASGIHQAASLLGVSPGLLEDPIISIHLGE